VRRLGPDSTINQSSRSDGAGADLQQMPTVWTGARPEAAIPGAAASGQGDRAARFAAEPLKDFHRPTCVPFTAANLVLRRDEGSGPAGTDGRVKPCWVRPRHPMAHNRKSATLPKSRRYRMYGTNVINCYSQGGVRVVTADRERSFMVAARLVTDPISESACELEVRARPSRPDQPCPRRLGAEKALS